MLLLALLAAFPLAHATAEPRVDAEEPDAPAVTWGAAEATYRVAIPAEGPLTVTLEWRLAATTPGWAELPLAGPNLVVREATGPVIAGPGGLYALLGPGSPRTIRVTGTLDRSGPGAAALRVLPAARQRVVVDAPGLDVTIAGATDGWLTGDRLALTWAPRAAPVAAAPIAPLVRAEASTAVWAEPGALLSQTVARWKVVRGATDRFELDVTGLEEVDVEGANVARTVREGTRLVLYAREPVKSTFEARIRARRAVTGDGEVPAPAPRPVASRVERFWTVGRAEDGELVPIGGPRAVPVRALPEWGRGLSDTAVVSAWQGDAALRVRLARYTPLMGPDTVIERAQLVVAAAVEGRALVRTTWHVRNERKQYLHVTPPAGMRPITARVSGEAVLVLADGTGGVYVPLEKSVETVQGLLTFPVELTWIAEGEAWAKKGDRALELPAVDAPIQAAEWEVYLPRGVTAKGATSAVAALPPAEDEAGAEALQNAVVAYKKNDFAASNAWLEQARSAGSTSANVDRLQSNLDALLDKDDQAPDDVATRRVRELANARTVTMQVEQEKKTEEARRAYAEGDVDKAEAYLEEVVALAEDIGVTEQKESAEQADKKTQALALLSQVKKQKASFKSVDPGAGGQAPPQRPPEEPVVADAEADEDRRVTYKPRTEIDFEGLDLEGELVAPDGNLVLDRRQSASPAGGEDATGDDGDEVTPIVAEEEESEPETTTTVTKEFLSRVPAGRTYQDTVRTAAGVASTGGRAGRKDAAREGGKGGAAAKPAPSAPPPPPPAPPPSPAKMPATAAPMPIVADEAPVYADGPTTGAFGGAPEAPSPRDASVASAAEPAPNQRLEPERRAALDVKAAPLTLAMPLGGPLVRATTALLPAGTSPTLTIPYRRTGVDP